MPDPRLVKAVLSLVEELTPRPRNVLDISCKRGELLLELARRGFRVRGTNFEREPAPPSEIQVDFDVDLMKGLPYPDESFDLVCLIEVIEHLENHRVAVSEMARVTRPGGAIIITTPNIMRLNSRLAFLLSGFHKTKRRLTPLDTPIEQSHRYHNYPISFPLLYYLLLSHGLRVERLGHGRVKAIAYVLYPLLYPLVAANTRFRLLRRERDPSQRERNRELMEWMLNRRLLMEDNLIVLARKVAKPSGSEHDLATRDPSLSASQLGARDAV